MRRLFAAVFVLGLLGSSSQVVAQMTGNVDRLKANLHGVDLDRAVAAASALGSLSKDARARDALLGALQLGAPPKLTLALLEAIGQHKDPQALPLLRHYAANRRVKIRVAALRAIGELGVKEIDPVLIDALGDSNPMVRARAARLLGQRKVHRAEGPLFKMLKRGDKAAAGPLGKVGGVEAAKRLAELIGEVPDEAIADAYGEMLKRKDFGPDPLRVQVVKALCKLPGVSATGALVEYIAVVPPKEIRLSKKIAEQCVEKRQK